VVTAVPGLYFVGLGFLFAMSSSMIHGVGRDAARIVAAVKARRRELGVRQPDAEPAPGVASSGGPVEPHQLAGSASR
jgi:putative flavoprotein involved in K+ transport